MRGTAFNVAPVSGQSLSGTATLFSLHSDDFGAMRLLNSLELREGALHALADAPVREGATVSIGFENSSLLARRGVVRHCHVVGESYHVRVEIEPRLAA